MSMTITYVVKDLAALADHFDEMATKRMARVEGARLQKDKAQLETEAATLQEAAEVIRNTKIEGAE